MRDYYHKRPEYAVAAKARATEWNKVNKERRKQITAKSRAKDNSATLRSKWRKLGIDIASLPEKSAKCQLCGSQDRICLDHDHATKKFRGWLCNACNLGLGYFKDSPMLLNKAAAYLGSN